MDDVNMRSRANTTSTILKKIQKGDTVTILGVTGSFYRVEFDGKTGYAMKKYIDGTDPSPDPSPNPALSMQAPPGHIRISLRYHGHRLREAAQGRPDGGRGHPDHSRRQRGYGV